MKPLAKTAAGIRTSQFTNATLFVTKVINLEIVHFDKEKEFARFKLPSGDFLEIFGSKNLWHPFTTPPKWELILAEIRINQDEEGAS